MTLYLAYNTTPWALPSQVEDAEPVETELAEQPRYRVEALTDQIIVVDTVREAAHTLLVHTFELDPDSELYCSLFDDYCIVASYVEDEFAAFGDPMGEMMGRNE